MQDSNWLLVIKDGGSGTRTVVPARKKKRKSSSNFPAKPFALHPETRRRLGVTAGLQIPRAQGAEMDLFKAGAPSRSWLRDSVWLTDKLTVSSCMVQPLLD